MLKVEGRSPLPVKENDYKRTYVAEYGKGCVLLQVECVSEDHMLDCSIVYTRTDKTGNVCVQREGSYRLEKTMSYGDFSKRLRRVLGNEHSCLKNLSRHQIYLRICNFFGIEKEPVVA